MLTRMAAASGSRPARQQGPRSHPGRRTVALVLVATALPVVSLVWASRVARTEVEDRALAGLAATAKATVLQEQQAWDGAVRIVLSAASRPVPLSALESRDTTLAIQGLQNILITGPFADVRLYSLTGDLIAVATLPGVTPTPVGHLGPGPAEFGPPTSVGDRLVRQVSAPAGIAGRMVVDIDMSQLLGKPSDLAFGRTGGKFLVTPDGVIVAGSLAVGTPLRSEVNRAIVARRTAVTEAVFDPLHGRLTVESYEPVPDQDLGILVQQARSEVMAGADHLSALLHWVALVIGVLGAALAVSLGVLLGRRGRRLAASERRLSESEAVSRRAAEEVQFLSVVTAHMSEGVVVVRAADATVAYANGSYESMFGYDAGELVGRPLSELIAAETGSSDDVVLAIRQAVEDGATWRGEIRGRRRDGSIFWCALNVTAFDHPAFGPAWIAVNTNVDARRHAEEAQSRLASIVEASRDAILGTTPDGVVTSWNHGAEVLFGYAAADMIGRPVDVLVPADGMEQEADLRREVARGVGLEKTETIRLRKGGTPVHVSVTMSPIHDAGGRVGGIATICRDVTERNRAEAKFQGLLESAPDAILVVGADGLVRLVNRQTEVLFGYERAELLGQPVERLIPERFAAGHPQMRSGFNADPSVRAMGANVELAARRKDGSEFPVDISLAPLETEEGMLVSAAVRDVTERKQAEAALLEREAELALARDQAVEASRLKSDFLANMSHEIRTPMNAVIGLTGLMLDSPLTAAQREYASAVRSAGEALMDIINDILDFSKIEAGKLRLEPTDFDLRAAIDEVADLLSSKAHEKGLELTTFVGPDVPAFVRGDAGRLRQILTNLVGNAIKFSDRGSVRVRVGATSHTAEVTSLRFDVTDTGIGISPAGQRQLFQAFEQVDSSASRRHGGTGLGLAICKQLVEMMGGEIGLDSTEGRGSTFWFAVDLPRAAAPPRRRVTSDPGVTRSPRGARLLVAEDNPVNQLVAVRMLERLGYRADVAANGLEAVDALMRVDYAAVLMDCQMPELDGYEATREIRRRQGSARRTPVIAMTAAATQGDRDRCFESDMDDYISKPVRAAELDGVLARWIPAEAAAG
jgi:PAS domain S-box-containing protein